ncbi:Josephin-domain-containing protein [Schizopora paradoxa]|uniref:ubiquitinyl hydrolase 1 n=1 Tax=Schizopora paradoxa TaxID=27342 RepID=A0A0H2S5H6_9AGAM|nr:Josephin-domain-containing protein [Schizopora paradoxa]
MSRMNLRALADIIYHEKQQRGSMLCAQHALNSLLQGNYFTAPDLAHIAHSFDTLEQGTLDEASRQSTSTNMDDTGFFSVQVMEEALKVWGLNLVRWRSEDMRPHNSEPYKQLAFVLNLQQHWFTLRRFGSASSDFTQDAGEGHWFNLNSTLLKPQWISKTYLGMVLQQSEDEGYSVFAVVQANPDQDLVLQRTEADIIAATIPEPESDDPPSASEGVASGSGVREHIEIPEDTEELEDNDMELQAALQASITGGNFGFEWDENEAGPTHAPVRAPELRHAPLPPGFPPFPQPMQDVPGSSLDDESDPVAASMARNRVMMDRMRREQEAALRETYEAEVAAGFPPGGRAGVAGQGAGMAVEEDDEDEQIRRAIAASMEEGDEEHPIIVDDDDEDEDAEKENVGVRLPARPPGISSPDSGAAPPNIAVLHDRVYDDEDQAFQAAIRASLETMPQGFVAPVTPPPRPPQSSVSVSAPGPSTITSQPATTTNTTSENKDDEDEYKPEDASSPAPAPVEPLSMEEIRRRRLAKFGG